jgi:hypothetical protein
VSHGCHAAGCTKKVPPRLFACRAHWFRLPAVVRAAVLREYRPGQENDKKPTVAYMAVQQYAVAYLAARDGLQEESDQAVVNAIMYEAKTRETTKVDPLRGLPRFWEKAS